VRRNAEPLTRQTILEAALELINRDGLQGFSMRKLGDALGVKAMSIYSHIPSKEDILDGVLEVLYQRMQYPHELHQSPRMQLEQLAHAFRNLLRAYPNVLPLVATRPLRTQSGLSFIESILEIIQRAGIREENAIYTLNCLAGYVIGHALLDVGSVPMKGVEKETTGTLNLEQLPESQFPNLHLVTPKLARRNPDEEFNFGLNALLNGLLGPK
jgi:AcrR family transcriptional regulator